jgi:glycosyltransferase involved in cell wall biosynthesis
MIGTEFHYEPKARYSNKVNFVTTGNLLPVKGFDNLINAFNKLNLPPDTWSLNIIGGGKERANLQQLIDSVGLGENIHLCGRKNREGVIEMLHNSDVYVMSSRSETFGVAAIEALACGLPVIATDCGGARDFVTKENGVICPVNEVDGLSESIRYMMNHYQAYDRTKIAEDCQKRFSSEAIGKQLEGIFEEVLRKSKKE